MSWILAKVLDMYPGGFSFFEYPGGYSEPGIVYPGCISRTNVLSGICPDTIRIIRTIQWWPRVPFFFAGGDTSIRGLIHGLSSGLSLNVDSNLLIQCPGFQGLVLSGKFSPALDDPRTILIRANRDSPGQFVDPADRPKFVYTKSTLQSIKSSRREIEKKNCRLSGS